MEKRRKRLITLLKIVFSVLLIYFVFTKIPFKEVWSVLRTVKIGPLIIAIAFFTLSKMIAAFRLNLFFHQLEVNLTQWSNVKLYLLGMFYNLFLPGGIGGDAYKGYVIKKQFEIKTKRVVSVLLLDRLSGLLLLFIYACFAGLFINNQSMTNFRWLFVLFIVLSSLLFWILNRRYFAYVYKVYWKSLGYSALVQLCQILCIYLILLGFGIDENILPYIFIFLISSVVAVLPLTIGGIGSREVVFFYGALWLGLQESTSVSISMLFFFVTALVSLMGVYFHFKGVNLEVVEGRLEPGS